MAAVTKSKSSYPDVNNVENWKYTTTNNIKNFADKDQAKRFISGTCKIWKLDAYKNGNAFIHNLLQSIDELYENNVTGFEYVDEKDDMCYILFVIQFVNERKSIQISHTQHKISKTGARRNAADIIQIEENSAAQWLIQRACEELHLPNQITNDMLSKKLNALEHPTGKYHIEEHDLTVDKQKELMRRIQSLGHENHYHIMHMSYHGRSFLYSIPEIATFSKYLNRPDEFVDNLEKQLRNIEKLKELFCSLHASNGETYTLNIAANPEKDMAHLCVFLQEQRSGARK